MECTSSNNGLQFLRNELYFNKSQDIISMVVGPECIKKMFAPSPSVTKATGDFQARGLVPSPEYMRNIFPREELYRVVWKKHFLSISFNLNDINYELFTSSLLNYECI